MGFTSIAFSARRDKKPRFKPGWLVLAQDEHGLRWLHMVHEPERKPRVLAWQNVPALGGIQDQLRSISLAGKLRRFRCLATLRPDEYQIVQAELPPVAPDELRQALRWTIRELVDYPVDDVGVDYLDVPFDRSRGGISRSAYVVCARRAALERYVTAFQQTKSRLHVCDVAETAHRNLAALCAVAGKGVALLGVMPDYCLLSFTFEDELCMSRRIDIGLRGMQAANGSARTQLFERVLLEVQRSLDAFERQFHFASLSGLMVSPLPDEVDLMPFLVDNMDLKVESLDLASILDFSAVQDLLEPTQLAACLTLLGAGLRSEAAVEVLG